MPARKGYEVKEEMIKQSYSRIQQEYEKNKEETTNQDHFKQMNKLKFNSRECNILPTWDLDKLPKPLTPEKINQMRRSLMEKHDLKKFMKTNNRISDLN